MPCDCNRCSISISEFYLLDAYVWNQIDNCLIFEDTARGNHVFLIAQKLAVSKKWAELAGSSALIAFHSMKDAYYSTFERKLFVRSFWGWSMTSSGRALLDGSPHRR
jgi:hypothetical protein